jgi:dolichyl-phosphate-mannose-protein mannosyltransferase
MKKCIPLIVLLVLSLFVHFFFLSHPAEVVFDEVHFGKFVSAYFTHAYYFDIHPPLGKLLIAGFAKIFGYQGNLDFLQIGEAFSAHALFVLRFLPALFGALLPLLVYKLFGTFGISKKTAFLGGLLVIFDNALLVQSKFILVDIFFILFGITSLYFYFFAKNSGSFPRYIFSAIFAGLALSVKWTALSFLGIIFVVIFAEFLKNKNSVILLKKFAIFCSIPFFIYIFSFAVHFSLLGKTGAGDAFMSQAFQKTLEGNKIGTDVRSLSFWGKFIELNKAMYIYNASITAKHQDGSKFYEWPLMKKPIWYWAKNFEGKFSNIYLLPNPVVWIAAGFSIILSIILLTISKFRKRLQPWIYLFVLGYFVNILPFILVGRVTFLYHYLPSLIFGILMVCLIWDKVLPDNKISKFFYIFFIFLIFIAFFVLSPLSYGFSVSAGMHKFYDILVAILH